MDNEYPVAMIPAKDGTWAVCYLVAEKLTLVEATIKMEEELAKQRLLSDGC